MSRRHDGSPSTVRTNRLRSTASLLSFNYCTSLRIRWAILLAASTIALFLEQQVDALIIVTMVVLGVSINFWQSYRSQQAADRLRSSVSPTATVIRDGTWQETPLPPSCQATCSGCRPAIRARPMRRLLEVRDLRFSNRC